MRKTYTGQLKNTFWASVIILVLSGLGANAATFTVLNAADSGGGSLRQAVLDANALAGADIINFDAVVFSAPQTITLASTITINGSNDTLTINGPGVNFLTISGNNAVRIFSVSAGETTSINNMTLTLASGSGNGGAIGNSGASLTVTDLVITANAASSSGGGISNSSGSLLNVVNCTISGNVANGTNINGDGGGGIYNTGGTVTISGSTITANTSNGGGGGIRTEGGSINATGTTLSNNTSSSFGNADGGGGMYSSGTVTFTNSMISANTASSSAPLTSATDGGGIMNEHQLTLDNSIVTGNFSTGDGGGIMNSATVAGDFVTITDSTISTNTSNSDGGTTGNGDGGGLNSTSGTVTTITRSTFTGNVANGSSTAMGNGAGISCDGALDLVNSTVSGNNAGRDFGGIRVSAGTINITGSTIAGNTAIRDAGGVGGAAGAAPNVGNTIIADNSDDGTSPDLGCPITSLGFNLIENTTGATINGVTISNKTGQDPMLGPLAPNGGPTQTRALMAGSPAIDAGSSFTLTTDQRGQARPRETPLANAPGSDGSDMGAYELLAPSAASVTISGRVTAEGRPVGRVYVTLTAPNGEMLRALTTPFGYYRIDGVEAGRAYTVNAVSKQYQFLPRVVMITDEVAGLDISAEEISRGPDK